MNLDSILDGLHVKDRVYRIQNTLRKAATGIALAAALTTNYAPVEQPQYNKSTYTQAQDEFYVHVPSWVRVERAPFHQFGPNLFGLAYIGTGLVRVREDLEGLQYAEVLQHEVFHQLYPNNSEQQIRQFTLSRMGNKAKIHTHMCKP
jgi:hypothetical protein